MKKPCLSIDSPAQRQKSRRQAGPKLGIVQDDDYDDEIGAEDDDDDVDLIDEANFKIESGNFNPPGGAAAFKKPQLDSAFNRRHEPHKSFASPELVVNESNHTQEYYNETESESSRIRAGPSLVIDSGEDDDDDDLSF